MINQKHGLLHVNFNQIKKELRLLHDKQVEGEHASFIFKHPAPLSFYRYKLAYENYPELKKQLMEPEGIISDNLHLYAFKNGASFKEFDHSPELYVAKNSASSKWQDSITVPFRAQYLMNKVLQDQCCQGRLIQFIAFKVLSENINEFASYWNQWAGGFIKSSAGAILYNLVQGLENKDHPFAKDLVEYPRQMSIIYFKDENHFLSCWRNFDYGAHKKRLAKSGSEVVMRSEWILRKYWYREFAGNKKIHQGP